MSVRNFLRRQADVNHSSRSNTLSKSSLERPLSEYDNIKAPSSNQTHFPLSDIKFRFDDSPQPTTSSMNISNQSAVHYNNSEDSQTTIRPVHQYENVASTLQARNKRESDQQVKMSDDHSSLPRSVMSVAKSSFFGLNEQQKLPNEEDEFDKLIEEIGNVKIVPNQQYMNVPNPDYNDDSKVQSNQDKVSATSSASGSSSATATPSSSPTRQDRTGSSRKNSEGSNRSKSPKFMLPESSLTPSSPSQVNYSGR